MGSNGDLRLNDIRLHKGCARSNGTLYGGAILVLSGNLHVNNVTFDENRASHRGGAIDAQGADIFITNSLFINNAVSSTAGSAYTGVGGAISYNNSTGQGMLTVVNTTFVNNYAESSSEAGSGSAIYIYFTDSETDLQNLTHVTVVGNQNGSGNTGAVAVKDNSELNIYNSIISGNSSDCTFEGSPVVNAFNNVFGINDDASGCTGFNNAGGNVVAPENLASIIATNGGGDPLLANNGGPTQTIALIAGSPAVNAGDNQYLPGEGSLGMDIDGDGNSDHPIDVDQRGAGFGRVFGYSVDAGAFEYRGVDVSGDGIVSPVDAVYVINRVGIDDLSADVDSDNDDVLTIQNALGTTP